MRTVVLAWLLGCVFSQTSRADTPKGPPVTYRFDALPEGWSVATAAGQLQARLDVKTAGGTEHASVSLTSFDASVQSADEVRSLLRKQLEARLIQEGANSEMFRDGAGFREVVAFINDRHAFGYVTRDPRTKRAHGFLVSSRAEGGRHHAVAFATRPNRSLGHDGIEDFLRRVHIDWHHAVGKARVELTAGKATNDGLRIALEVPPGCSFSVYSTRTETKVTCRSESVISSVHFDPDNNLTSEELAVATLDKEIDSIVSADWDKPTSHDVGSVAVNGQAWARATATVLARKTGQSRQIESYVYKVPGATVHALTYHRDPDPGSASKMTSLIHSIRVDSRAGTADYRKAVEQTVHSVAHRPSFEGYHSCRLTGAGAVECRGENRDGQLGRKQGFGTQRVQRRYRRVDGLPGPVASLAAGGDTTCALTAKGEVYCWGGMLHQEKSPWRPTHMPVPGPVSELRMSGTHACALTRSEELYCWGDNSWGQLGGGARGFMISNNKPVRVEGLFPRTISFAVANTSTCALSIDGQVSCWGIGVKNGGNRNAVFHDRPTVVENLSARPLALAIGQSHGCALLATGKVACFQASEGDTSPEPRLRTIEAPIATRSIALSSEPHSSCALGDDGKARCWWHTQTSWVSSWPTFKVPLVEIDRPTPDPARGNTTGASCANQRCGPLAKRQ